MIQVREVMTAIRFQLGDMPKAQFSDFEVMEAVNQALRAIYARFGERHINAGLKKTYLTIGPEEHTTLLPANFHNVHKVFSVERETEALYVTKHPGVFLHPCVSYRIFGTAFEAGPGSYLFEYFFLPPPASNETDLLDIPLSVSSTLEMVSAAMLRGDAASAVALIDRLCNDLVAQEVSRYENVGPVQVWGGKA